MPYFSPDYPFPGDAYLYFGKGLAKIFHRLQGIFMVGDYYFFRQLRKFIGSDAPQARQQRVAVGPRKAQSRLFNASIDTC
ncbi:hypothetical protein [Raoultella planticola]|uniref:hypothetical protein n=1 Tax=Raoultella planticola TaxID=575 RepID=UPI00197DF66C|nr:hypothetical protein [Raoultella planticola]MDU4420880.1 hypothetical protein [Raoultella sp.]HDG9771980.1 hypothetical protein [Raoultella planticola]